MAIPRQESENASVSPGHQVAGADTILRLYNDLGVTRQQELLQFARDLFEENARSPLRLGPGRWDDDRVYFEILEGSRRISCSVSREAIEEAGPGRRARRWQLLEAFDRLRPRINQIARNMYERDPDPARIVMISSEDLNSDPAPAAPAVALRARAGE